MRKIANSQEYYDNYMDQNCLIKFSKMMEISLGTQTEKSGYGLRDFLNQGVFSQYYFFTASIRA